jgi:pimeloyl-ACP methyl ester carboxylesterase/ketosteroid isomerase-like protein
MTRHHTIEIDDLSVFVREAGDRNAPAIVLLHGFPTSSHMFRELIPLLADKFRVIAPDLIGYGHSSAPQVGQFAYTFDNLAAITRKVLARLEVDSYLLYLHDFGGPVGLRLAAAEPERVRGLVIQNANAYMEGVSDAVAGLFMPLWKERNAQTEAAVRGFMTAEATRMQYTAGARAPLALDPDAWTIDQALLDRPGVADAQLELFVDYQNNVAAYEAWHAYFRARQPRTLVVWGKNDPFFVAAGAEAFRRDLPQADIVLLDGGHFALEEYAPEIAGHIKRVFASADGGDVVRAFYAALGDGKLDAALSLLADDVRWSDPKGFPYGGALTSPMQVRRQVFEAIAADWPSFSIVPERFIEGTDGRSVVVLGRYTGKHGATRRSLDVPFAHVWGTADGAISSFFTHTDTAELQAAMAV